MFRKSVKSTLILTLASITLFSSYSPTNASKNPPLAPPNFDLGSALSTNIIEVDINNRSQLEQIKNDPSLRTSTLRIKDNIEKIPAGTFLNWKNLSFIEIPNSVTIIGEDAFSGCTGLQSIAIPNSITTIGKSAFVGCSSLQNINIPNSVTTVGGGAFQCCTSLQNINIPNNVTFIGWKAFENCISLENITIPNSVTEIGIVAYYQCAGANPQYETIPNSVFANCSALQITYNNHTYNVPDFLAEFNRLHSHN